MNITDVFIDEMLSITERQLPTRVVHQIKRCLLDYIGVTFAGANSKKEEFRAYLESNSTNGNCPVIGLDTKTDFSTAGLLNGFASHVLELDDGHRYAMLHLGAPIISALLTIAKKENLTVMQVFKGVVVGYEATVRLAKAIQPMHKNRGYHATGTCGTIGAAFAVATALGLSKEQIKNAINFAATSSSGLLEVIDDASQIKAYNVSAAVLNGITAAYFGRLGFIGPRDILGGNRGFFKTLTGEFDEDALLQETEAIYQIEKIYVKPYAACRHSHSAIEGALLIRSRAKVDLADIDKVEVKTYKLAVFGHDHTEIEGVSSAKMSTPYGVAVALILNDAGIDAFDEAVIHRKDIIDLCKKIKIREDEKLTSLSPGKRGALVKIFMKDGQVLEQLVEHPLGEPENNITDQELEKKYTSLMKHSGKSDDDIRKISKLVWSIEDSFDEFVSLL